MFCPCVGCARTSLGLMVKTMTKVKLCGYRDEPEWNQFEPCPLEKGHEGEHVYWYQVSMGGKRHNINVVNENGERLLHVQYDGKATAEEVGVLLEYMNFVKDFRRG